MPCGRLPIQFELLISLGLNLYILSSDELKKRVVQTHPNNNDVSGYIHCNRLAIKTLGCDKAAPVSKGKPKL